MEDVGRAMAEEARVEALHADVIDRVERYINRYYQGECDLRSLIRIIIKHIEAGR